MKLRVGKGFAAGGSLLIHLLLLYLFVNKLIGADDIIRSPGSNGPSLVVFDLADPSDSPKAKPEQTVAAPIETPQPPAPSLPAEWKMTRLPPMPANSSSSAASTPAPPSPPAGGAPSAGGGDYDPYAGAAPLRLVPSVAGTNPALAKPGETAAPPAGSLTIDADLIEKIKSLIRRKIKGSAPVTMTVTVGTDGTLLDVQFSGLDRNMAEQVWNYLTHVRFLKTNGRLIQPETRTIALR